MWFWGTYRCLERFCLIVRFQMIDEQLTRCVFQLLIHEWFLWKHTLNRKLPCTHTHTIYGMTIYAHLGGRRVYVLWECVT